MASTIALRFGLIIMAQNYGFILVLNCPIRANCGKLLEPRTRSPTRSAQRRNETAAEKLDAKGQSQTTQWPCFRARAEACASQGLADDGSILVSSETAAPKRFRGRARAKTPLAVQYYNITLPRRTQSKGSAGVRPAGRGEVWPQGIVTWQQRAAIAVSSDAVELVVIAQDHPGCKLFSA